MLGTFVRHSGVVVGERGFVAIFGLEQLGRLGVELGLGLLGLALEIVGPFGGLFFVVLGRVRRLLQLDGLLVQLTDAIVEIGFVAFQGNRAVAQPNQLLVLVR
ncbi:MAG: hypothetical protein WDO74_11805 [Pseudomonadota bacterium]